MNRSAVSAARPVLLSAVVVLAFLSLWSGLTTSPLAQSRDVPNPGTFGAMTCQQFWYVEQQVLAEGRVCLKSERARRAFRRSERCISTSEAILSRNTRDYLSQLRAVAGKKGCSGF